MKKKTLALVLALVLVVGCVAGGTVAWLFDKTEPVKNTFTTSDIDIKLEETENDFKMVPGYTIEKDPKVTVSADSEKCYLFVKVEKSSNFDTFLQYEMADGWTQGNGTEIPDDVWYRTVDTGNSEQVFDVLKDNQVTVLDTVTKEMMNALTQDSYPTLTVTAYASQFNKNATETFTVAEAWNNIAGSSL